MINDGEVIQLNIEAVLPIRHQVLWPNKNTDFCRVVGDEKALHYGLQLQGIIVCVASIYIDQHSARLRKFATLPLHQKKGYGSRLLQCIFDDLTKQGIHHF